MKKCYNLLFIILFFSCNSSNDEVKIKELEQKIENIKNNLHIKDSIESQKKITTKSATSNNQDYDLQNKFIFIALHYKEGTKNTKISSSPVPGAPPLQSEWVDWKDYQIVSDIIEVQNLTEDEEFKQIDNFQKSFLKNRISYNTEVKFINRVCKKYSTYAEASMARQSLMNQ